MATLVGWRLVGYFDRGKVETVPRVLDAVLDDGERLVHLPIVDELSDLDTAPVLAPVEFDRLVAMGSVQPLPRQSWHRNDVLFIAENEKGPPQFLDVDDAHTRMTCFVADCRRQGYEKIATSRDEALDFFDRARRVSNETDDYVRVYVLDQTATRAMWLDWLERHAGTLDIEARARELGLVPMTGDDFCDLALCGQSPARASICHSS